MHMHATSHLIIVTKCMLGDTGEQPVISLDMNGYQYIVKLRRCHILKYLNND